MAKNIRIIKVTWLDAQKIDVGLEDIENLKDIKPVLCEIVGFLVHEDNKHLILAQEYWKNEGKVKYINVIPKCLVESRKVLS